MRDDRLTSDQLRRILIDKAQGGAEVYAEELKADVEQVPGVSQVSWSRYKTALGNNGRHFMARILIVKSELFHKPFVFEYTLNLHVDNKTHAATVIICFQQAPAGLELEACKTLMHVAGTRAIFPVEAEARHRNPMRQFGDQDPVSETPEVKDKEPFPTGLNVVLLPRPSGMHRTMTKCPGEAAVSQTPQPAAQTPTLGSRRARASEDRNNKEQVEHAAAQAPNPR